MQRERRLPQLVQREFAADPGQLLEHVMDVLADLLVGRHQPEVGVEACGARMVVAGAEVHVAAQRRLAGLHDAPHDQHHLRVTLVADHAVHDMCADGFELRRPVDVGFLVEAREQLDDDGHFLAVARGFHQRVHQRRVGAGAVDRLLDRDDARVFRGLLQQFEHGLEAFVRVVQQDVAVVDRVEHRRRVRDCGRNRRGERRELQVGAVDEIGNLHQAHEVHGPGHAIAVLVAELAFSSRRRTICGGVSADTSRRTALPR